MLKNNFVIFGLSNSYALANKISKILKIPLGAITILNFADGEIFVKPEKSLRGKDVFVIQSTSKPVNDNLMELLIAIDAIKRASAKSITAIIPYYGYARQDRKTSGREPITSKLVADLLSVSGATRVCLIDIHSEQIQGFFNVPVDTLRATWIITAELLKIYPLKKITIVSPDYGGVKRARNLATKLNTPLAIVDKRRTKPNESESFAVLGDIKNRDCVIIDDILDTGGTMFAAAKLLKANGANKVSIMVTHGLFNKNAIVMLKEMIKNKIIEKIWITDSVPQKDEIKNIPEVEIVSLANFLADVIKVYINNNSTSVLYDKYYKLALKNVR